MSKIEAVDLVARASDQRYAKILAPVASHNDDSDEKSTPMISFSYDTFSKARQPVEAYPGWDAAAKAQLASMRAVVIYAFIDRYYCLSFFFSFCDINLI